MIGSIDTKIRKATVVGGGISGLLIAYELDRRGFEVELYEKSPRLGGLISTHVFSEGIAESAAHSLLVTESVKNLMEELGVHIVSVNPKSKSRWIVRDNVIRRFPLRINEVIMAFIRLLFVPGISNQISMSVSQWTRRHLGIAVDQYLVNPAMAGIYAASPEVLSVSALMPDIRPPAGRSLFIHLILKRIFRENKSKRFGMHAPHKGMESVVKALEDKLRQRLGDRLYLNTEWSFELEKKDRNLILTFPADVLSEVFKKKEPALSEIAADIQYAPLVSCTVFARASDFSKLPSGVGFLVPEVENSQILGVLFNSSSFGSRVSDLDKWLSLTVMLGGMRSPEWEQRSDDEIQQTVQDHLKRYLKWNGVEIRTHIFRWKRAIPIYDSNIEMFWKAARGGWCKKPGNIIFGNHAGQVSIRGMIEAVRSLET